MAMDDADNGASRTPEQIEAANRFHSYMRGWQDGAAMRSKREEFRAHRLEEIYERGYGDGVAAFGMASASAGAAYEHRPSILRSDA